MARETAILQSNFSAGVLDEEIALRRDTQQYRDGMSSLRNSRLLIAGGAARRPGSWRYLELTGDGRLYEFVVDRSTQYVLAFLSGAMNAYSRNVSTGVLTAAGSVTGAPWGVDEAREMDVFSYGNTIVVTHAGFLKFITRTGASTWTMSDFPWFEGSNGRVHQPHFKIAPAAITLQPSALTGSITLLASASYFTSDHVGLRLRILDREVEITGYTDATHVTALVKETLRPTQILTVDDATNFALGDVVTGETSFAKGEVTALGDTVKIVTAAAIVDGGSGFNVGDLLNVVGGVGDAARVQVGTESAGVITSLSISVAGNYSTPPTNPVSLIPFTGSGGGTPTATLTFSDVVTTMTVVITDKMTTFTAEDIVGPNDTLHASAAVSAAANAAVKDWTEQLYSGINGYPECGEIHRDRILFAGSAGARNAIAGSTLANIYDFDVGTGSDGDGFLEKIGDSSAVQVVRILSHEQLLVFTDQGPYYVPESSANPFRPSSLGFNPFGGNWPCAKLRPEKYDGGVVFVSNSIIVKCFKTGNQTGMWDALEKSFLSPHLVASPTDMCVTSNYAGGPERYCMFRNSDGTLAVMMLVDAEQVRNFVQWRRDTGIWRSMCAILGDVYLIVSVSIDGVDKFWLERFDKELTLDSVTEYASVAAMNTGKLDVYGNSAMHVVTAAPAYLGAWPLSYVSVPPGPYRLGFNYGRTLKTLPPNIDQGARYGDMIRIAAIDVGVVESARFEANGTLLNAYRSNEDQSAAPPLRTGPQHFDCLGWDIEPVVTIQQDEPMPLTITGIKTKVFY